jgi:hypothetical protein
MGLFGQKDKKDKQGRSLRTKPALQAVVTEISQKNQDRHSPQLCQRGGRLSAELPFSAGTMADFGAVDEWFKSHAWKACVG